MRRFYPVPGEFVVKPPSASGKSGGNTHLFIDETITSRLEKFVDGRTMKNKSPGACDVADLGGIIGVHGLDSVVRR